MAYTVRLKRSAEKELGRLPKKSHDRIVEHLVALQETPRPTGAKKLVGREGYRILVGDYRILYTIDDRAEDIEVVSIADRKEVYRR